ncbi:N-acetylglucosamine-6-phosphate deacetylase [Chiayiivirga flava]|uniref:N-acetylglucosamine-6-phosphate deacetylase n=1 Tax=Chiayiivirga flava TaxID=659595 RepID=A0A7W8D8I4_9GAMM|nr:N-acetylglucosamine-6-phosphate deacetylase [Chiayiivirga flava]MBB5208742.1 N-acetylglucosamine-6-phosphate deacetylase [Chiayiivirga flava]
MAVHLVNGRVLVGEEFVDGVTVRLEGERIVAVDADAKLRDASATRHDLRGAWLVPGFIDCQVNGGGGVLFNGNPSVEGIRRIGAAHRRFGTTAFLPTLISDDAATMRAALAAVDAAIAQGVPGVIGVHLEGPYLAPARQGTHDAAQFRVPDADEIALATSLRGSVTLITLAPERLPVDTLRALQAGGAILAAGHTAATFEQMRTALDAGVRGFTHLYNAMTPLQGREPGAVGAALDDRDSWCGIIVDGHHVHAASLRVALAAKPCGKVFLVTDAMPPVGSDDPAFVLYGETITAVDGICRNAAGALAGSALDMAAAVRNSVGTLGVSLAEAARMASLYPAQFLGLASERGRIAAGMRADLAVLDAGLDVVATYIGGVREQVRS